MIERIVLILDTHSAVYRALYGFIMKQWIPIQETFNYRQISNISRTLLGNKLVDHLDVDGA